MKTAIELAVAAGFPISRIADELGESIQTVSNWRGRGVPVEKCSALESATTGAVKRWHMRPDDWHRIWPELIGQEGAPAIPEATQAQG